MANENSVEFDLAELLNGSVDSVKAKLGDMPVDQLRKLLELESGDKKRETLISAINAEGKSRDDLVADGSANEPLTYTKAEVDELLDRQKKRLGDAHAKVVEKLKAEVPKAGKNAAAVKPLVLSPKARGIVDEVFSGVTKIMFVDADNRPLPGLPALPFEPYDYRRSHDRAILDVEVRFPPGLAGHDVVGAFVLNGDGAPVAVARLVAPFHVGGGMTAVLPPSALSFEGGPSAAAAA
jgi:hypothetical protein